MHFVEVLQDNVTITECKHLKNPLYGIGKSFIYAVSGEYFF